MDEPLPLYDIPTFGRRYGIGRSATYTEINSGRLRAVKRGSRTFVLHADAEAWMATLPEAVPGQQPKKRAAP